MNKTLSSPLSLLLPLALSSTAMAQPSQELTEIIVTAEFRPVTLLQQEGSTSVLTQDTIRALAGQHLEDILNQAPNVNYAGGSSRARFYQIRGIGERSQFQEPLNPSIGLIVDNIDFSGLGTAGTLFDVQQVEVLRGPQGTLHGANALAGLVNIRSAAPTADPYLHAEAQYGNYDTWSAGIVGSGPLIADTLLYRLAVQTYRSDGYLENDFLDRDDTNSRDERTVRGKLRWLAGDQHTLDVTALYVDVENGYDAFSLDNTRHTLSDEPGQDNQESSALGLHWRSELQHFDMEALGSVATSETDYSYDEDWSFVGIHPWGYSSFDRYLRDRDSYSAELRLLSNDNSRLFGDRADWVSGVYYLANREDLQRQYTYLDGDYFSQYDTDTLALFGQLDTALTEQLTLVTGLRAERRSTDYGDSNGVAFDPDKNLWGGRISLEYRSESDALVYATISRGYRANGVNAEILASIDTTDDPALIDSLEGVRSYDEESLLNYELGYKAGLLANTLQVRGALFYMDRQDQQVKGSFVIPQDDGGTSFIDYTNNAAAGNNYGLELELNWLPTDALSLYASLGLLHTELEDYVNADGVDLSGREQAHAPGYQFATGGRLDLGGGFYVRMDLEGKDSFYFSDRHDLKAPSYELLHARAGWSNGKWSFALWGRNLTDEDYFVRGFGSFGNDPRKDYVTEPYFQFGDPRTLGVYASYDF